VAESKLTDKYEILDFLDEAVKICKKSNHISKEKISEVVETSREFFERWCE